MRHVSPPLISHILCPLELGCYQFIKFNITGKLVDEQHKRAADAERPLSHTGIRNIAELKVIDIKELGKLNTVC